MTATREICKRCHEESAVGFTVPDEVWAAVVPESLQGSVLCVRCFTDLGDQNRVQWDRQIEFWPVSRVTLEAPR
jgi:hypothetical protein